MTERVQWSELSEGLQKSMGRAMDSAGQGGATRDHVGLSGSHSISVRLKHIVPVEKW